VLTLPFIARRFRWLSGSCDRNAPTSVVVHVFSGRKVGQRRVRVALNCCSANIVYMTLGGDVAISYSIVVAPTSFVERTPQRATPDVTCT